MSQNDPRKENVVYCIKGLRSNLGLGPLNESEAPSVEHQEH